ncbi:hypothetical protein JHK84_034429 [Glycine max]|nr:hypothetical protein JHK84_034429 [Glycine max]
MEKVIKNKVAKAVTFVTENEVALIAARGEGTQVTMEHFEEGRASALSLATKMVESMKYLPYQGSTVDCWSRIYIGDSVCEKSYFDAFVGFQAKFLHFKRCLCVPDAETEVIGVETQVNNGADDDEVKEHDEDVDFFNLSESDLDYVFVSLEDDGQSSDTNRWTNVCLLVVLPILEEVGVCVYVQSMLSSFGAFVEQPSANFESTPTPNAESALASTLTTTQSTPTPSTE